MGTMMTYMQTNYTEGPVRAFILRISVKSMVFTLVLTKTFALFNKIKKTQSSTS